MTATRPGKALAEELQAESHSATLHPTMARLIEAVASHVLTEALYFRLLDQLSANLSISRFEVTPDACTGAATCLESGPVPEVELPYEESTAMQVVWSLWVVYGHMFVASNVFE